MSYLGTLQNIVEKTGEVVGGAVDGTVQITTKAFSAVAESFASVSTFGKKGGDKGKDSKGKGKGKDGFTAQLPSGSFQQVGEKDFAAVGDAPAAPTPDEQELKRQREAAFRKAAAEAEKLTWQGRDWEHRRRETWSGQAERNLVGGGPVTYQQAILAQPMPMLSPLRGTNTPQGVRAIVDASVGTTTATFNPALGTPGVAIPSNATAGSLDASIKVNVQNTGGAPAAGVTSTFAAMFD